MADDWVKALLAEGALPLVAGAPAPVRRAGGGFLAPSVAMDVDVRTPHVTCAAQSEADALALATVYAISGVGLAALFIIFFTLLQPPATATYFRTDGTFTVLTVSVNNLAAFAGCCVGAAVFGAAARAVYRAEAHFRHARRAPQAGGPAVALGALCALWWSIFAFVAVAALTSHALFATGLLGGLLLTEVGLRVADACVCAGAG